MNKYSAKQIVYDNISFDSKAEMHRYCELKLLESTGQISKLVVQPPFKIIEPNKEKGEQGAKYTADFMYVEKGKFVVEDVKSVVTAKKADYILRRKLFKQKYPDIVFRETIR